MLKIALIFGGKSCENEISVLTGVFVLNLLDREKYQPVPVYIDVDGGMYTSDKMNDLNVFKKKDYASFRRVFFDNGCIYTFNQARTKVKKLGKIDAALNCCHGGLGEGGGVSALMQLNEIPLASPTLDSSAVFMDKTLTKLIAKGLDIPTVEYLCINEADYARRGAFVLRSIASKLKYPVIIKPSKLGSSIGIALAKSEEDAKAALEAAFLLDERVLVEKFLTEKKDVNCAAYALKNEIFVSNAEVAASSSGVYSFADKYIKDRGRGETSDTLPENLTEKIRSYTKTIYKKMHLSGVVRMDFLVSENDVFLSEVNTVPGSLAYYLFCERVKDAKNFFSDLIDNALAEKRDKQIVRTGILQSVNARSKRGVRL
jgi:D-alanine-D-alanine ligase